MQKYYENILFKVGYTQTCTSLKSSTMCVTTPLWGKCEVATHIPENGTWESFGTPENLEHDYRDQNTSHWCVLYTVGKVLKYRCSKWPRMNHLDNCSISYGWMAVWLPTIKSGNRPDLGVCKRSTTNYWKALKESYKFALDLVLIRGWSEKLWTPKVPGVQTGIVSGLHFGSPGKKCHSNASATKRHIEYYMGEGGGFPRVWAVVN